MLSSWALTLLRDIDKASLMLFHSKFVNSTQKQKNINFICIFRITHKF